MLEVNLTSVIEAIDSDDPKPRQRGLNDLEKLLKDNRHSSELRNIDSHGVDFLIKSLLKTAVLEKAALVKARDAQASKSRNLKPSTVTAHLTAWSAAILMTVDIGVTRLRYKPTIRPLVAHIIAMTADKSGGFEEDLISDHFKILLTILAHRPHLEHLAEKEWKSLLDFSCNALAFVNESLMQPPETPLALANRSLSRVGRSRRAGTPSAASQTSLSKSQSAERPFATYQGRTDDIASCIALLMSVQHIKISSQAESVRDTVSTVLQSTISQNKVSTQQSCLTVLHRILYNAMTEDVPLALRTLSDAILFCRRHWSPKLAQGVKVPMLAILTSGKSLFQRLADDFTESGHREELDGLLDRLLTEYMGRLTKEMLSIHDIDFGTVKATDRQGLLSMPGFQARPVEMAETCWAQLSVIAILFGQMRMGKTSATVVNSTSLQSKRRKLETPLYALLNAIQAAKHEEIVASLQVLVFVLGHVHLPTDQLQYTFERLIPLTSRDNNEISNWSVLALAALGHQKKAPEANSNETTWLQALSVATSRFSAFRVSRASCHLANVILCNGLVSFADASDVLEGLFGALDVSGPVYVDDASTAFWCTVLASYNAHRFASLETVSQSIIRWLFTSWRPSQSGLSRMRFVRVTCIIDLLAVLLGGSISKSPLIRSTLLPLSRASFIYERDYTLLTYLLQEESKPLPGAVKKNDDSSAAKLPGSMTKGRRALLNMVCDYLSTEAENLLNAYSEASQPHDVSLALLHGSLSICIIALGLYDEAASQDVGRSNILLKQATRLRESTAMACLSPELPKDRLEEMLKTLFHVFEDLSNTSVRSFKSPTMAHAGTVRVARSFGKAFWAQLAHSGGETDEIGHDEGCMLIDESQQSRSSWSTEAQATQDIAYEWTAAYTNHNSYRASICAELCLASELPDPATLPSDDGGTLPSGVIDYLISLNPLQFLAARPFFDEVYGADLHIKAQDAAKLLDFLAEKIFESYDLERCETALGACVDLMSYLVTKWAGPDANEVLADAAEQLYTYFLRLERFHLTTPHVSTCLAHLLQKIIRVDANYGHSQGLPSARTILFQILAEGNTKVKFEISKSVSAIFGVFILREHDTILDDIETSIPHDPDSVSITAVRLFLLSRLAASWSTLIRRCVYAIVEATGLFPEVQPYAQSRLSFIGKELEISNQHDLFKLFVSQILYTWLETRSISALPYAIFDYPTLENLVQDCKHEMSSQVVMRGKEDEIKLIERCTGTPIRDLLLESFGRCAAYCIARDTAIAPEVDPQAAHAAVRLRKLVGKDAYKTMITEKFPEIVATFFRIVDREDQITKGFQKHRRNAAAQEALESMMLSGASQYTPPVSQQPSFKSNCLLDELEYICDKSPYDIGDLWTPALYVFVFRALLETIQPPLGPLHAAAVIRRIRILVSMSGDIAKEGYSLEMALTSLRPFLNNTHSAEDVMGLYRYLLSSGRVYLSQNSVFLGGFIVSILATLRAFIDRPQETTTQESVFKATLARAEEFHKWIGQFMRGIQNATGNCGTTNLKALLDAASNLHGKGSSRSGSPEGRLLLGILHDEAYSENLIDDASRKEVVKTLAQHFEYSGNASKDILGDDHLAAALAPTAWQYFDIETANEAFKLWILRSLGRAYASSGSVDRSFRREIAEHVEFGAQDLSHLDPLLRSTRGILRTLFDTARSGSTAEAGAAERTLQSLVTQANIDGHLEHVSSAIPKQALSAMTWNDFFAPSLACPIYEAKSIQEVFDLQPDFALSAWARDLSISLIDNSTETDSFLAVLKPVLLTIPHLAEGILHYILHLVLAREAGRSEETRKAISAQLHRFLDQFTPGLESRVKKMISTLIYLRSQPMPFEKTKIDRANWIEVDYKLAADVAVRCNMHKTALLFVEIALSTESKWKGSRRSSAVAKMNIPTGLLLTIFRNIEEKDYYYGVRQPSSLESMMEQLEFEGSSFESLAFRGTTYDTEIKQHGKPSPVAVNALIRGLNDMQLSGLSYALFGGTESTMSSVGEAAFDAARKLERWDIPTSSTQPGPTLSLYQALEDIQHIDSAEQALAIVGRRLEEMFPLQHAQRPVSVHSPVFWSSLASLIEIEEILTAENPDQLEKVCLNLEQRNKWMESATFPSIDRLLSSRETLFAILSKSKTLQQLSGSTPKRTQQLRIQKLLSSSSNSRHHGNLHKSLAAATMIERLLPECQKLGLEVEAIARVEASNVLWDQGQMAPSIQILRDIICSLDLRQQDIPVGRPDILAKLASRTAEARLEQPDNVLASYLEPAVKELRGNTGGGEAGQVFHEFASFCDRQLQDPDSQEDFQRVKKLREDKLAEVHELDAMVKKASSTKERESYKAHRNKTKNWFELDNAEYKRLQGSRDALLTRALDMYLLCLRACDDYDRDSMRFSALWLQHFDDKVANDAVKRHLKEVPSSKFASLMNQWTSRLLDETSEFHTLLSDLIFRICGDHPYHAMYNIFVTSKSRGGKDATSLSRHAAANHIVERFKQRKEYGSKWITVHNACVNYQRFAIEQNPSGDKWKQGTKMLLRKISAGQKLEQDVVSLRVPPPIMKVALRKDCDYKDVPFIIKWTAEFSIASGLSAPKIVTATASNGQKYKMLFKAGNDDPRQDAIMEQVFEQVSDLLQAHRETRRRKLGIRSYKVLPLTHTSGVIEFVQDTIPLHEYLIPAHQDHYPNDLKNTTARKTIQDAAHSGRGNEHRIKEFRKVCEKFHPVLRFFFMERFSSPDEWFETRLAYTRSTAAISMLGHVLGLGDRHGHNILLDEKTGEVIHIDLGIAFEQGRVLPVPELVPFRLTRDVIDGMGVTKTEGVFRRCCEFTLDALRKESWGIMTVLDVLRFDPLYSWSISPLRLRRLQANQSQAEDEVSAEDGIPVQGKTEKKENEEAEADRALTVVNKKLSKSLSVEATVNQLIQQATDEKNLALLFAGWAAYA